MRLGRTVRSLPSKEVMRPVLLLLQPALEIEWGVSSVGSLLDTSEVVMFLIRAEVFRVASIPTKQHSVGVDAASDDAFTLNAETHKEPLVVVIIP